ncbi:MAG: hypothetical protein Q8M31_19900 [Beijerinckiaceae bacterium]|nr:hypothetical protein [Beijerinckiaceae bacterium]
MSNAHIDDLILMRDLLVEDRRGKVKVMLTSRPGSIGSQFHDNLVRLQAAISAVDDAIADERALL